MRALALPIGGGKAIDLVALGGAVPGRGLETLALHIERHGGALPGQQVRNDKARGLAAARGRHDQRMRERPSSRCNWRGSSGVPSLPRMNPVPGSPKNPLAFISRARLPMGLAKACEGGARQGEAQHQAGGGEAADDQVNKLRVLRAAIAGSPR